MLCTCAGQGRPCPASSARPSGPALGCPASAPRSICPVTGADKDDGASTDGPCTAERDSLLCVKGTVETSSK